MSDRREARFVPLAIMAALCIGLISWVRFKYLTENFGNFDVAGIVYNAELILDGGLPYRDTFEMKTPFLFYLFAFVFWLFGRSLIYVRLVWGAWLLLTCFLLFGLVNRIALRDDHEDRKERNLHDQISSLSGAVAAVLLAVYGSLFDINYASWLVLPLTMSIYSYVRGRQAGSKYWLLVCGASASLAYFIKNPGGFIIIVFLVLELGPVALSRKWREIKEPIIALSLIGLGCIAGFIPLFLHYLWKGEIASLLKGLFPGWILKGVLLADSGSGGGLLIIQNMGRGIVQAFTLFPLPAIFALASILAMLFRRSLMGTYGAIALSWFIVSFFSVAITGGRFYPHHTVLYLPSLVLLSVHPGALREFIRIIEGITEAWLKRTAIFLMITTVLCGLFLATANIVQDKRYVYDWPAPVGKPEPQRIIGEYIKKNTKSTDTIIAWGWFAWPVYHWSSRRSPSSIYKEMGILTTVSTNTHWTYSKPIHFVPSPIADKYLRDVTIKKPAFIIVSNWYPWISKSRTDPLFEFKGLFDFIRANYVLDTEASQFKVFRHNDHKIITDAVK